MSAVIDIRNNYVLFNFSLDMDVGVLGVHTAQKTAVLAQEGEYTHSRLNAHFMNNLVHRNA